MPPGEKLPQPKNMLRIFGRHWIRITSCREIIYRKHMNSEKSTRERRLAVGDYVWSASTARRLIRHIKFKHKSITTDSKDVLRCRTPVRHSEKNELDSGLVDQVNKPEKRNPRQIRTLIHTKGMTEMWGDLFTASPNYSLEI